MPLPSFFLRARKLYVWAFALLTISSPLLTLLLQGLIISGSWFTWSSFSGWAATVWGKISTSDTFSFAGGYKFTGGLFFGLSCVFAIMFLIGVVCLIKHISMLRRNSSAGCQSPCSSKLLSSRILNRWVICHLLPTSILFGWIVYLISLYKTKPVILNCGGEEFVEGDETEGELSEDDDEGDDSEDEAELAGDTEEPVVTDKKAVAKKTKVSAKAKKKEMEKASELDEFDL